jgi:hypothetical protein
MKQKINTYYNMNNLFQLLIIIIIFSLLHIVLTLSINISNIKKNWPHYKCDPTIMPLAGVFGHDPIENAEQCIKTMQVDFMGGFLEPIYASLSTIGNFGEEFGKMFVDLQKFGDLNQALSFDIFNGLTTRAELGKAAVSDIFNDIDNAMGSGLASFTNITYTIQSFIEMANVTQQELTGTIIDILRTTNS